MTKQVITIAHPERLHIVFLDVNRQHMKIYSATSLSVYDVHVQFNNVNKLQ